MKAYKLTGKWYMAKSPLCYNAHEWFALFTGAFTYQGYRLKHLAWGSMEYSYSFDATITDAVVRCAF